MTTPNAIKDILANNEPQNPVVQVLSWKRLTTTDQAGNPSERFRLTISDGEAKHNSAMLATQLNGIITNNEIKDNGLLRLNQYLVNTVNEKKVIIIILKAEVVTPDVGHVIGNVAVKKAPKAEATVPSNNNNNNSSSSASTSSVKKESKLAANPYKSPPKLPSSRMDTPAGITPITSLHPYLNRWTILARAASKPIRREWRNQNGEGYLFSVDLVDQSGAIRATAFKENCDRLLPLFEKGQAYRISGGTLKLANKRFNNLDNQYEVTFDSNTQVVLDTSGDSASLPEQQFAFKSFAEMEKMNVTREHQTYVDVLAVIHKAGDLDTIITKSSGQELSKRDLTLIDRGAATLTCTLWGDDAEKFEENGGEQGCVMAIKGARLSDYNGRSLSVARNSSVFYNLDLPDAHSIKGWYGMEGAHAETHSLTVRNQGGSAPTIVLSQIKDDGIGMQDGKTETFSVIATVNHMKKDNCLYQACAGEGCNKKVTEHGVDEFWCEKCKVARPTFSWRMILQMSIADSTGQSWCTAFQESAEQLLGCTTQELAAWKDSDEAAFNQKFEQANFKTWRFLCRARSDTYQDETRVRVSVSSVKPLNFVEETTALLNQISLYSS